VSPQKIAVVVFKGHMPILLHKKKINTDTVVKLQEYKIQFKTITKRKWQCL